MKDKIQKVIDDSFNNLVKYVNAYQQKMIMKREAIANKAIWVAKKRYMMNVFDEEGIRFDIPKLKIMGVEAVKSSTPEVCRGKIKDAIRVIMNDSEDALIKFVADFKEVFKTLSLEGLFPRSCNNIDKYVDSNSIYKKGHTYSCKRRLIYNHHILKNKLQRKYPLIKDGDKIKFLMLRQPNTVKDTVISFSTKIPYEFDLHKYVDYDTQFTKTFTDPLRFVLDSIGWKLEREATLESFFCMIASLILLYLTVFISFQWGQRIAMTPIDIEYFYFNFMYMDISKKYNVIYADPPWSFKTFSDKGKDRSPENHYNVMTLQDIKDLPVSKIANNDSVLLMWVVDPLLDKAFEVINAWGFKYKTVAFTWAKTNKKSDGFLSTGLRILDTRQSRDVFISNKR